MFEEEHPEPEPSVLESETYVCEAGHLTESYLHPGSGDYQSGFHERCRRVVDPSTPAALDRWYEVDAWAGRCGRSLIRARLVPEVLSTFRLGGEPAVQALIGAIGWESIAATKE